MERGVIFVFLALAAAVQSALGLMSAAPQYRIELVIMTALYFSAGKGWRTGVLMGAMAGIAKDIFSIEALGYNMVVLGIGCGVGAVLKELFFSESPMINILYLGLLCFVSGLINIWGYGSMSATVLGQLCVFVLVNMLVCPFVFGFFNRIKNAIQKNFLFF